MAANIDEINNLMVMVEVMKALEVPADGLNSLDQMKFRVKEEISKSQRKCGWTAGQTFKVLSEARQTDVNKRKNLRQFYLDTRTFLDQLDSDFTSTLKKSLGDFRATLEEHLGNLTKEQYVVLVAGETSSGKSSIINLILGEELLPYSVLSTTSTIWELKYGEKPKVGVHYKDSASESLQPVCQELVGPKESYLQQLETFLQLNNTDREKGSLYKKIELFWPHPLFKEGVMIVDSPGVGESDVMDEFVFGYLPDAFAFIYVINSLNAGGIQQDRGHRPSLEDFVQFASYFKHSQLGRLLLRLKTDAKVDPKLSTSRALFVCNKWDQIPPNEAEQVKQKQIELLKKRTGGVLDPDSQIVYLSCTRAQLAQRHGMITKDFAALIDGIRNLVVVAMQSNLQICSRWLDDLLYNAHRQIRVLLRATNISRSELEKRMKEIAIRMTRLETSQDLLFDDLSKYHADSIKEIVEKLAVFFKSEETSKRFCEWSEAPPPRSTWDETKSDVLECISQRAQQFIQDWEGEEKEFGKAQVELIKYFVDKYNIMEDEIHMMEEQFFADGQHDVSSCRREGIQLIEPRLMDKKVASGVNAPVWFRQGLASVVVGSTMTEILTLGKKSQEKSNQKKYNKDPLAYLVKQSADCLKLIASPGRLLSFVTLQLNDAMLLLNQIKSKISQLREGDKELYQKLLTDTMMKKRIQGTFEPLSMRLDSLKSKVAVYVIGEVRQSDFTRKELSMDDKSVVGRGTFSTVHSGVLCRQGELEIKVALKVYNELITSSNVWHFIQEETALRKLHHPNIVIFFGTNLQQTLNGTEVMFVLELCECTLKTRITSHPEDAPAYSTDQSTRKDVFSWAQQILEALRYVHRERFIHRDLKLDNLLLTKDNRVKLADVGVTKREEEITGTVCGTLLYLAPEILEGRGYSSKADMYSFGLVLWELWYGRTVFDDRSRYQDLAAVRDGPRHIEGTNPPWRLWQELMETSWNKDPSHRLTASDSLELLEVLSKEENLGNDPTCEPSQVQTQAQTFDPLEESSGCAASFEPDKQSTDQEDSQALGVASGNSAFSTIPTATGPKETQSPEPPSTKKRFNFMKFKPKPKPESKAKAVWYFSETDDMDAHKQQ